MKEQSLYMKLVPFRTKPFSFVINYQGIDVVIDFWVERATQESAQFTVDGTMFMKSGAELLGKMVINLSTGSHSIKIKGDRHVYSFSPTHESQEHWNKFVAELKKNDMEWNLLSKAILDSMGSYNLYFVQPDGGIGNKAITLGFESILNVGNNGFILFGNGKVSGKKICRGKFVDDIRKIKIFYDANTKTYSWVSTYRVNYQRNICATRNSNLIFPKGDSHEMLENKIHEEQLFAIINDYIDKVNSNLSPDLQLKLRL